MFYTQHDFRIGDEVKFFYHGALRHVVDIEKVSETGITGWDQSRDENGKQRGYRTYRYDKMAKLEHVAHNAKFAEAYK